MTLDEAYRHIKASYIHHSQERNAVFLPQAELIAMECIEKCKQAGAQPVKRGYWKDIMMSEAAGWDLSLTGGKDAVCETVCSVCGGGCAFDGDGEALLSQYCPDCGARMDGDTE